jgi:hypothetical protein
MFERTTARQFERVGHRTAVIVHTPSQAAVSALLLAGGVVGSLGPNAADSTESHVEATE